MFGVGIFTGLVHILYVVVLCILFWTFGVLCVYFLDIFFWFQLQYTCYTDQLPAVENMYFNQLAPVENEHLTYIDQLPAVVLLGLLQRFFLVARRL